MDSIYKTEEISADVSSPKYHVLTFRTERMDGQDMKACDLPSVSGLITSDLLLWAKRASCLWTDIEDGVMVSKFLAYI